MAAPLTISAASDAVDVAIQKYFLKDVGTVKEEYWRKFYNTTSGVTDYYMKDSGLSGLGDAARITENAVIVAESPVQTNSQTYTQIQYGKVLTFTWMMWKFGIKKRNVERISKALVNACKHKREKLLHGKLDAAHLGSYSESDPAGAFTINTTGGDGSFLCTASHTREDGGTAWSNLISDGTTTNLHLDYPGLKGLWRVAALVVGPKGQTMDINPTRIVVKKGTTAAFRAREILGALKNNKIPGEFSNDGAAINSFELIETPYLLGTGDTTSTTNLSSATNWHAFDPAMINDEYGLQYFESQPIGLEGPDIVFRTNEIQFKSTMAFAYGHNDARGSFHSEGDN